MDAHAQSPSIKHGPCARAGRWLRELREKRGLSQRELARMVGAEYYTIISQLESGVGRVPADRYLVWAGALGIEPREFASKLMSCYEHGTGMAGRTAGSSDFRRAAQPDPARSGADCTPETD